MDTFQYNGPGNIVIDTCHPCDLIWLDYGELHKVVNAPGSDRGVPRAKPSEDNENAQTGDLEDKITFKDLISVILEELL
jgi:Zn-finger nucleic acid-binding protein